MTHHLDVNLTNDEFASLCSAMRACYRSFRRVNQHKEANTLRDVMQKITDATPKEQRQHLMLWFNSKA